LAAPDLTIKVAPLSDPRDPSAAGAVKRYSDPSRPRKLQGVWLNPQTGAKDKVSRGQIKMSDRHLIQQRDSAPGTFTFIIPVLTLIHEASHRYADTNDFYYNSDFLSPTWHDAETKEHVLFPRRELLIINADTYAWFAVCLYYLSSE
jgi:hypothetical protein